MSSHWIERALPLFHTACELPARERAAFLDQACGEDAVLRRHLEAMLELDDSTERDAATDLTAPEGVRAALSDLAEAASTAADGGAAEGASLPARIGAYRVTRRIARGGMGTVYEGAQEHPARRVAIKVARVDQTTPELARRFALEAQLLARLRHPRIAQIIEAGTTSAEDGARPFFVMEYVEGQTLTEYAAAPHSTRDKLELMAAVCDAIGFAHERGVIHRDLKPDNVLIEASGEPKVLDFGVAKVEAAGGFGAATLRTEAGRVLGTMGYMSPEQLAGMTEGLGPEADVYSLGVMLYEVLTGRLPHDLGGATLTEALAIVTSTEAPLLGVVRPEFRGDIEAVVAKALEKEARHRYPDATALRRDLERHLRGEPVLARPAGPLRRFTKWSRRNPALATSVFAAFLLLTVGLGITLVMLQQVDHARANTQNSLATAFLEKTERALADRDFGAAAVFAAAAIENNPDNPDGAYFRPRQDPQEIAAARTRRARMAAAQFDAVAGRRLRVERDLPLPAEEDPRRPGRPRYPLTWPARNLDFHPDGTRLAAGIEIEHVVVWEIEEPDAAPRLLPAGPDADLWSHVRWSPDGMRLAAVRLDAVRIWTTDDYEPGDLAAGSRPRCLAFAPDAHHLAVGTADGTVQLWSIEPEPYRLEEEFALRGDVAQALGYHPSGLRLAVGGRNRVQLWDLAGADPRLLQSQPIVDRTVPGALAFAPGGGHFLTTTYRNSLYLWSGVDGHRVAERNTAVRATSAAFLDDDHFVYTGFGGRGALVEIRPPDLSSPGALEAELVTLDTLHFRGTDYSCVSTSRGRKPDGSKDEAGDVLIATHSGGRPRLHRLSDPGLMRRVGPVDMPNVIVRTQDGRQLVHAAHPWTLVHYEDIPPSGDLRYARRRDVMLDAATMQRLGVGRTGDALSGLLLSPDERWLVAVTFARCCLLWPFPALDSPHVLVTQDALLDYPTQAGAFAPDSSAVFYGTMRGEIVRRSLVGEADRTVRRGDGVEVLSLAVSPDGRWLASGDVRGRVRLSDLERPGVFHPLQRDGGKNPYRSMATGLAFSPDGRELATAGRQPNHVILWDLESEPPRLRRELVGHSAWVYGVFYSPDGTRLLSSANDSLAMLWDRATGWLVQAVPLDVQAGFTADNEFWVTVEHELVLRKVGGGGQLDQTAESLRDAERAIGMRLQGMDLVPDSPAR